MIEKYVALYILDDLDGTRYGPYFYRKNDEESKTRAVTRARGMQSYLNEMHIDTTIISIGE